MRVGFGEQEVPEEAEASPWGASLEVRLEGAGALRAGVVGQWDAAEPWRREGPCKPDGGEVGSQRSRRHSVLKPRREGTCRSRGRVHPVSSDGFSGRAAGECAVCRLNRDHSASFKSNLKV